LRFAIVGCGYVADYYVSTLRNHANLELAGVFDRNSERLRRFAEFHGGLHRYRSLEEMLNDSTIQLVANLTNPCSHFAVSKAGLEAGKHVYSEKPLAMCLNEARELVELAEQRGLFLTSAPCNLLSETAQTLWKALRQGRIGTPRLAYAELNDSYLFMDYRNWANGSGAPWPFEDEFKIGCTLEHSGYYLGLLTAFFGPAKRVTSFAHVLLQEKGGIADCDTPDFAVGCIEFASGPVARITCSIYTSRDHGLRIFGDEGVLSIPDCWDYGAPVCLDLRNPKSWRERHPRKANALGMERPGVPLVRPSKFKSYADHTHRMDFSRGIAELADAAAENRQPRQSARWSLHMTELALAMSEGGGTQRGMRTTFEPIAPMPWAK
jgi:predicted dehydrogenase